MKILCTNPATRRAKCEGVVVATPDGKPCEVPDDLAKQLIKTGHYEEVTSSRKKEND